MTGLAKHKVSWSMLVKKQSGAALIMVLSLLAISLMVGLSSIQSSQIDERLAGNYRAQAQAQMNAERVVSELYERISISDHVDKKVIAKSFEEFGIGFGWEEFQSLSGEEEYLESCYNLSGSLGGACFLEISQGYLGLDEGEYIIAMGAVGDGAAVETVIVKIESVSSKIISGVDAALT